MSLKGLIFSQKVYKITFYKKKLLVFTQTSKLDHFRLLFTLKNALKSVLYKINDYYN